MRLKIINIFLIGLLIASFSILNAQTNEKVSKPYSNISAFIQFNPNNSYSFIVYKKGDLVEYKGEIYKAIEKANNNTTPNKDSRWELLAKQPNPLASKSPK